MFALYKAMDHPISQGSLISLIFTAVVLPVTMIFLCCRKYLKQTPTHHFHIVRKTVHKDQVIINITLNLNSSLCIELKKPHTTKYLTEARHQSHHNDEHNYKECVQIHGEKICMYTLDVMIFGPDLKKIQEMFFDPCTDTNIAGYIPFYDHLSNKFTIMKVSKRVVNNEQQLPCKQYTVYKFEEEAQCLCDEFHKNPVMIIPRNHLT